MEVQKEAFAGLIEYYKKLPISEKRNEIINVLEEIISCYTKICVSMNIVPDMSLNKEMLNIKTNEVEENEFLEAIFAYLNALQDISSQFIDVMSNILEKK